MVNKLFAPLVLSSYTLSGIKTLGGDVSKWQGLMDWRRASSSGWKFTFIRLGSISTDGVCYKDYQYDRNSAIAPEVMLTGAYWYFRPAHSAIRQADYVLDHLQGKKFKLPFVVDCENNDTKMSNYYVEKRISEFVDAIHKGVGRYPIVYTSPGWWSWPNIYAYDKRPDWAYKADLWVANYTLIKPQLPATWASKGYKFWQFTDKADGEKYGVPRDPGAPPPSVDLNWFNGSVFELEMYASDATVPEPPEPEPEPEPSSFQMEVIASALNVRTGPSTNYPVVETLSKGTIVTVEDVAGSSAWVKIGTDKWAASQYGSSRYLKPK